MTRLLFALVLGLAVVLPLGCSSKPEGKQPAGAKSVAMDDAQIKAAVKQQAEQIHRATMAGDHDKLIDATHPKIVEMLGGREGMKATIITQQKQFEAEGLSFARWSVSEPTALVSSGEKLFAIVPTSVSLKGPLRTVTQPSYLIGVSSDQGKSWVFLDGAGIGDEKEKVFQVIPEFPRDLKLPGKQQPVFE